MNIHDVIRYAVRRSGAFDETQLRDLLETVDGSEQGFGSLEDYREHQEKQRKAEADAAAAPDAAAPATAPAPATLTDAERTELEQLRAEAAARAQTTQHPAEPLPPPAPTL